MPSQSVPFNVDRALFWIGRRVRELEETTSQPDQEAMAQAGFSYAERQGAVLAAIVEEGKNANELETLRGIMSFLRELQ